MTVDQFLDLLHLHLTLLESGSWPGPHSASAGPALYLDSVATRSLIADLARLTGPRRLAQAGCVAESPPFPESATPLIASFPSPSTQG